MHKATLIEPGTGNQQPIKTSLFHLIKCKPDPSTVSSHDNSRSRDTLVHIWPTAHQKGPFHRSVETDCDESTQQRNDKPTQPARKIVRHPLFAYPCKLTDQPVRSEPLSET